MVILHSGGMDSTTLLYAALADGRKVNALGVLYGQRHSKELDAAAHICAVVGVHYQVVDLKALRHLWLGSSQTDSRVPVPHGHYAEESMKQTIVPNRNLTMLSVAAGWALSLEPESTVVDVGYAAHAGDHAIYPDCRPEFVEAAAKTLAIVDHRPVKIWAPFINKTKAQIAALGQSFDVPFELTWSCYEGKELHCGKCGTCVERREAFELSGVEDPTTYDPR